MASSRRPSLKNSSKKKSSTSKSSSSGSKSSSSKAGSKSSKSSASKSKAAPAKSKSKLVKRAAGSSSKSSTSSAKKGGGRAKAPRRATRPTSRPKRAKISKVVRVRTPPAEDPKALALARTIAGVATEKKAIDVTLIDVRAKGSAVGYDYVIVASAESDRQLSSIADAMTEKLKPEGRRALGVETSADWVLADYGEVIVHLLTPDRRAELDIEGQWSDAPRVAVNG